MEIQTEREINLIEIFWHILLGWRQIICFGILFALLIGGMKYSMNIKAYQASQNIDIEKAKIELGKEEQKKLADAIDIQKRIDEYVNYQNTSALMQIDPYEKHVLELQYYIKSDYIINYTKDSERDYTNELTSIYCNYINSGEMAQKIIDESGLSITQEDFRELLSVSQASNTIYITISFADTDKLEVICEVLKNYLQQKEPELQKIGSHSLNLIEESQNVIVDSSLIEKKNLIYSNITSLNSQLDTLKAGMSSEQQTILELEVEKMSGESEEEEVPSFSIKYLILGAIMGGFLVCLWIVCKMIFSVKLQNPEEIRNLYGARLFGEITVHGRKKRFLSTIDDKIMALKNRKKKKMTADQQIKVLSANIALSCKQQGIDCIYLTGSEYEEMDKTILDKLKKELSMQHIKVKDGGSISYDADSLQSGIEIGHIVFVEQTGQSIYDEIYNEINLVKEQHRDILGFVVLV
ncbi:MAG: hypothetical protein HFI71_00880 [Lachnospiraceae bacterium]|nr:hypothetical protein [Lachnospiraceae bacterium]